MVEQCTIGPQYSPEKILTRRSCRSCVLFRSRCSRTLRTDDAASSIPSDGELPHSRRIQSCCPHSPRGTPIIRETPGEVERAAAQMRASRPGGRARPRWRELARNQILRPRRALGRMISELRDGLRAPRPLTQTRSLTTEVRWGLGERARQPQFGSKLAARLRLVHSRWTD